MIDRALLDNAARRAISYLDSLSERKVAPSTGFVGLSGPLPEEPTDPAEVLRLLDEEGSPATVATAGPRYFGFVIGGSLPATVAASWLATAWDQNSYSPATSPLAARLEDIVIGWLVDLLGLHTGTGGAFVTGGTMANFAGLAAGRHAVLATNGWDVERQGLFGAPPISVVVGEEAHVSVFKALAMLGLGSERVIRVPVDNQGRMRADRLPTLTGPAIVCLQAGNVNTGSFDPMAEIIPVVKGAGAWVHVDGAIGAWAAASSAYRHLVAGLQGADSCATDAHKWLNVPYDSGLCLVANPSDLRAAFASTAAYLGTTSGRLPGDYTPESSRRARAIEVWAALRSLGKQGLAELVERCCRLARRFADGLASAGYPILNEVVLNQVLVSFGDRTAEVVAGLQAEGTMWAGTTTWQGRSAMRISVSNWSTSEADVDRSLDAIKRVAG